MWPFRKPFPKTVEQLQQAVCEAYIKGDTPARERLVSEFLKIATPEQVMELFWASLEEENSLSRMLAGLAERALQSAVKSLGPFAIQALLARIEDPDERWGSPKYWAITLLGEIGLSGEASALTAFVPILRIAMKPSLREATSPALGNLRRADPARWKELALGCSPEEQAYLRGAGTLSRGKSYEQATGKPWKEEYYLPGERRE